MTSTPHRDKVTISLSIKPFFPFLTMITGWFVLSLEMIWNFILRDTKNFWDNSCSYGKSAVVHFLDKDSQTAQEVRAQRRRSQNPLGSAWSASRNILVISGRRAKQENVSFQHQHNISWTYLHVVSLEEGPGFSEHLKGILPMPVRSSLWSCCRDGAPGSPAFCAASPGSRWGMGEHCPQSRWQLLFSMSVFLVMEIKAHSLGFRLFRHILFLVTLGNAEVVVVGVTNTNG